MKNIYSEQIDALRAVQKKYHFKRRPKSEQIHRLVHMLVKPLIKAHDSRARYFRLLATSALFNQEPLYRDWLHKKA